MRGRSRVSYNGAMKLLFDFLPLAVFFGVFKFYGIYTATTVSIAAAAVQLGVTRLLYRRMDAAALITFAVLVTLGGLTVILHNDAFIKWKPTLVYWIFAVAMLGSHFIGDK